MGAEDSGVDVPAPYPDELDCEVAYAEPELDISVDVWIKCSLRIPPGVWGVFGVRRRELARF